MAWRPGWDAVPRTEHAVLAAGEALEVASAAHFCCVSWLFCLLIAPLKSDVWPASQIVCSVRSLWAIAADAVFANSSSGEALIDAHNDLAMCCSDGVDLAPAKMSTGHAM
jgi:hypothetical protein